MEEPQYLYIEDALGQEPYLCAAAGGISDLACFPGAMCWLSEFTAHFCVSLQVS